MFRVAWLVEIRRYPVLDLWVPLPNGLHVQFPPYCVAFGRAVGQSDCTC
jgi:hypothetical protein